MKKSTIDQFSKKAIVLTQQEKKQLKGGDGTSENEDGIIIDETGAI